ncbi:hypothetical protein P4597_16670 [Peribacillus simplex]|uniref:hypothetical protein n=1 Tax=Peribacillus simplex TaxID=1478 RepID=UPI002E238AD8|nr:hypothetical protein [Peribacillus simplex]
MGVFFEKRKQSKKDFFLLIFIFALSIFNMVEYITDMDLFWLSDIVLIGIIVLSASIYFEGKRNRENDN